MITTENLRKNRAEAVDGKINALKELRKTNITKYQKEILKEVIEDLEYSKIDRDSILKVIIEIAKKQYKIKDTLDNISRKTDYVMARQLAHYLAYSYTKVSLRKIGNVIGGKDHSSVFHGAIKIQDCIDTNKKHPRMYEQECAILEMATRLLKKEYKGLSIKRIPEHKEI